MDFVIHTSVVRVTEGECRSDEGVMKYLRKLEKALNASYISTFINMRVTSYITMLAYLQ